MKIVITIDGLPDGASVGVTGLPVGARTSAILDDFETEPLPDPDRFGPDDSLGGIPAGQVREMYPQTNGNGQPVGEPSMRRQSSVAVAGVPPARIWQVGEVHQQGHKPLKSNRRGLFCPTAMGKDAQGQTVFCPWNP